MYLQINTAQSAIKLHTATIQSVSAVNVVKLQQPTKLATPGQTNNIPTYGNDTVMLS